MVDLILLLTWKSAALMAVATLLAFAYSRRSAAERHLIWLSAVAAVLALPLFTLSLPHWRPEVAAPALAGVARTVLTVSAGVEPSLAWGPLLTATWAIVAGALLLRLLLAQFLTWRLVRRAQPWRDHFGVPVLLTAETRMPCVCGLLRPVAVLPEEAILWPEERLQSVLRHESAHARRRDPLAQLLSELTCALYWPFPWVWLAASKLRLEAELACDDGVLRDGARPSDYAGHLIDIVRGLATGERWLERGVPMAKMSDLEIRVRALLATGRRRAAVGARARCTAAALSLSLLIPLAAFRSPAFAQQSGLTGVVRDSSGAVVPQARLTLIFTGSDRKEITRSGPDGTYRFGAVPDGRYELRVASPGFALTKMEGLAITGGTKIADITLNTGQIQESLTVTGDAPANKPLASGAAPERIRVGGNVQQSKLVRRPVPAYPPDCKAERVQGTVLFRAIIGKDGNILSLEQINEQVDARLAAEAKRAVAQWQYQPTLLNGNPVEVVTEIEVNFTLMS